MDCAVIVTGGEQRDSALCVHVSTLPQTHLPSGLPHNVEQVPCAIQQLCTGYPF